MVASFKSYELTVAAEISIFIQIHELENGRWNEEEVHNTEYVVIN